MLYFECDLSVILEEICENNHITTDHKDIAYGLINSIMTTLILFLQWLLSVTGM